MHCPYCPSDDSRVIDSRGVDDGYAIRRRRECADCGKRFSTMETSVLSVVKRSGVSEPFSRDKLIQGVKRACQGRNVADSQFSMLAQHVEHELRATGAAEVNAHEVGLAILGPLKELDEVAYLRFASVYKSFDSAADFEEEIRQLKS